MNNQHSRNDHQQEKEFSERIIQVNRVSKKTKGGNQMGFSVLVVIGDHKGRVGVGLGKAKDVVSSVRKGVNYAKKALIRVPLDGTTIPYAMRVKLGASQLMLKPAPSGSGIIAGGSVRAVLDAAGIRDVSSKIMGTNNPVSNVYATIEALKRMQVYVKKRGIVLKTKEEVEEKEKIELKEQERAEKKTAPVAAKAEKPGKASVKKAVNAPAKEAKPTKPAEKTEKPAAEQPVKAKEEKKD